MMTDKQPDKTVFRKPSVNVDRTVVPTSPVTPSQDNIFPETLTSPVQPEVAPQPQQNYSPNIDQSLHDMQLMQGLNPIVGAATTLMNVFSQIRSTVQHSNVGGLHQRLVSEIKTFESKIKEKELKPEIVLSARYVLCSALDEAVLNTPWGSESAWNQRTLLSVFHNETAGGEKFFLILERMRERPSENRDMLELLYLLISLGFQGKYRIMNRGRDALEDIRDDLFRTIRSQRGEYESTLSPQWEGLGKVRGSLRAYIPIWVLASIVGMILIASYSGFRLWLDDISKPVITELESIVTQHKPEDDT